MTLFALLYVLILYFIIFCCHKASCLGCSCTWLSDRFGEALEGQCCPQRIGMSRKQSGKPVRGNRKCELERKRDERAARRALAKDRKNRPPGEDEAEEFVSFSNQLKALGLKLREVPGDGYVKDFKSKLSLFHAQNLKRYQLPLCMHTLYVY